MVGMARSIGEHVAMIADDSAVRETSEETLARRADAVNKPAADCDEKRAVHGAISYRLVRTLARPFAALNLMHAMCQHY